MSQTPLFNAPRHRPPTPPWRSSPDRIGRRSTPGSPPCCRWSATSWPMSPAGSRASSTRDELISAGTLGLTQAAHSYDTGRGVTFQAFARMRIRGAVLDELRGRDPLSRGARRRANQITAAALALHETLGRAPTETETAGHLHVDVAVVRQARDDIARATQLERSTGDLDSSDVAERADTAEGGPPAVLLDAELRGYLIDAVVALPDRLRSIVVAHYFDGREMQDIAAELGVTASRVSQLCARAIALLRDGLNAQLDPDRVEDIDDTNDAASAGASTPTTRSWPTRRRSGRASTRGRPTPVAA